MVNIEPRVVGVEQILLRPRLDHEDDREEIETCLGKPVLIPVGVGTVANSLQHPLPYEGRETVCEHVAANAEIALEDTVATHAEECLTQHQKRPAIGEQVERAQYGIGFWAGARVVHP